MAEKVQLLKQEMALAELRKASAVAGGFGSTAPGAYQPAIAKMEHQAADMYVNNLRRFIEARRPTLGN